MSPKSNEGIVKEWRELFSKRGKGEQKTGKNYKSKRNNKKIKI